MVNKKLVLKGFAAIGFLLICVSILLAWQNPAQHYESSMYTATPVFTWVGLFVALAIGIIIVLHQVATSGYHDSKIWCLGLGIILLVNAAVLSLYIVRGYAFWTGSGDPASHIGFINDILASGHITSNNMYPVLHIWTAQINLITGLDIIDLGKIAPLFFSIVGLSFTYLWASLVFTDKRAVLLTTLVCTILVDGWRLNFTPNHMANMLFPMILYIFTKTINQRIRASEWSILVAIWIIALPLTHVVTAMMTVLIILAIGLPTLVFKVSRNHWRRPSGLMNFNLSLVLLLLIWSIVWISTQHAWYVVSKDLYQSMSGSGASGAARELLDTANYAAGLGYNVLTYSVKSYYDVILFIVITLIAFLILIKERTRSSENRLISLFGAWLILGLLFLATFFVRIYGVQRTQIYIIILSMPFAGFVFYKMLTRIKRKNIVVMPIIAFFIIGMSIFSIFKVYPSPFLESINAQTTYTEMNGMKWFLDERTSSLDIVGIRGAPGRMAELLYSTSYRYNAGLIWDTVSENGRVPPHFGYDKTTYLGDLYDNESYLILNDLDRKLYTEIYPELAKIYFLPEDFTRLDSDHTVNKLFANSGFDVYYIN